MHLLLTLLLAHLFADFPLQSNSLAQLKRTSIIGVLLHVLIYMVVTALLIQSPLTYWPLILGLTVAHFIIDALKMYCQTKNEIKCFIADQFLHFFTVALAAWLATVIWTPAPVGLLPTPLLIAAFFGALLLAFMVFCWLWINRLSEEQLQQHDLLRWAKYQMLTLEQRVGLVLLILVFLGQLVLW